MSQITYTGGGAFATSRRGGIDIDQLLRMRQKNPRASYQALSSMTGYSANDIRSALSEKLQTRLVVPETVKPPEPKGIPKPVVIATIETIIRSNMGIKAPIWAPSSAPLIRDARQLFVLFCVRYARTNGKDLQAHVGTTENLSRMRLEAYQNSTKAVIKKDFIAHGLAIEKLIRDAFHDAMTKPISRVF